MTSKATIQVSCTVAFTALAVAVCISPVLANENYGELYNAIKSENVVRVKTILIADAAVVNVSGEKKFTPLHYAAEHGSPKGMEILELLLAGKATVNAKNHIRQTPLFSAVVYDNPGGAKLLIDHGADVDARQDDGRTPLYWAAMNGEPEVVKVLIEKRATVNVRNEEGKTPLRAALEEEKSARKDGSASLIKKYEETIDLLREHGAKE